jgi:anti-anti-sigma factor
MSCEVKRTKGLIRVRGEMTIYAAATLAEQLRTAVAAQTGDCRIDLSEVTEMDTTGLQILLMAKRACAAADKSLAFVKPSTVVTESLSLLRIEAAASTAP